MHLNTANIDNGDTFIDTTTNLTWFKLNNMTLISFSDMTSNFSDSGNQFFRFRHATGGEVNTLWVGADILSPTTSNIDADVIQAATDYLAITEATVSNLLVERQLAFVSDGNHEIHELRLDSLQEVNTFSPLVSRGGDFISAGVGHYITAPIPEPETNIFFLTLIVGAIMWSQYHTNFTPEIKQEETSWEWGCPLSQVTGGVNKITWIRDEMSTDNST